MAAPELKDVLFGDGVDSHQYAEHFRSTQLSPEQALALRMLSDAIDDIERADRVGADRLRADAYYWVEFQPAMDDVMCSFEWCCTALHLDADVLRPRFLALRPNPQRQETKHRVTAHMPRRIGR